MTRRSFNTAKGAAARSSHASGIFEGHPQSTATLRVAVILQEKQVPYELIPLNIPAGEQKGPVHKQRHPFGQIPAIDDDGFVLYESRAIARYICNKYVSQGTPLVPTNTRALALFEQMASVEMANFEICGMEVARQMYYAPFFGLSTDEEASKTNLEKLNAVLAVYETILNKYKYIAGDQLTLVDLFHLPVIHLVEKVGLLSLGDKPNLARWWKEISSRPSWQAVKN